MVECRIGNYFTSMNNEVTLYFVVHPTVATNDFLVDLALINLVK